MNVKKIRNDFPILERKINGNPLIYFDNAATSQKPLAVIEAISDYYKKHNANVHRGIHTLSDESTQLYEGARKTIAEFIGANSANELIFTKGTTDSLNSLAISLCKEINTDDEIITTIAEHHSNFLPWQKLAEKRGAALKILKTVDNEKLFINELEKTLTEKTKIVTLTQASNVLGTIFPIMRIAEKVRQYNPNIKIVIDGAQSLPHIPVNVRKLNIDFFAFSAHKMMGPMGIGGLWIKNELLQWLEPFAVGGGMINEVTLKKSSWAEVPHKFEAGTPDVAGAIGWAKAIKYIEKIGGMKTLQKHCRELTKYAIENLQKIDGLKILGSADAEKRTGLVSFTVNGVHAHDIAGLLDSKGVAIRAGHHCAAPLHEELGISASARVSFQIYNTKEEIDYFVETLKEGLKILR